MTAIGVEAFSYCYDLKQVTIPKSVVTIGARAFHECRGLTICGTAGSYAQTYATKNKIPFVAL